MYINDSMMESAEPHLGFISDSDMPIIAGDMVMTNSMGFSDMEKLSGMINLYKTNDMPPNMAKTSIFRNDK